jgi:hypothetical protein
MPKPRADAAPLPTVRLGWWRMLLLAVVVAGLFAAYLLVELKQNGEAGFPLDDPWIHLTFARNLARGWGFVYNHGEPVAGSTAPLWTFILALVHLVTGRVVAIVVVAKLLGAAFLLVSAVFAFRIAARLTGSEWTGLAAGLAVATLGPMEWAMMSGMEVTLSVALTLAGIYYYLRFRTGWTSTLAWILFGLAAWARPESLSLAVFAALDSLLRRFALRQPVTFWRGFGVWLASVLAWVGFNYSLSGSLFPQTYLAKAGNTSLFAAIAAGSFPQLKGLLTVAAPSYFADFCVHLWRSNPALTLLVPVGLAGLVASALRHRRGPGLLIPLVVLGYVPLIGLVSPVFGAAFQSGRYIGNVTALTAVVAVTGIAYVGRWIRQPGARIGVTALLLGMVVFNAVTVSVATIRNTTRAESSINRMQVALGHWLADNTPPGAILACNDIGAIGYFSGRYILDLTGLVTKGILSYRQDRDPDIAVIKDRRPDFLVIYPVGHPGIEKAPFLRAIAYVDIKDNTASLVDIKPQPRTIAGLLVTDLLVQPISAVLTVFKCNWPPRP